MAVAREVKTDNDWRVQESLLISEQVRTLFEKQKGGLPGIVVLLASLEVAYRGAPLSYLLVWSGVVLTIAIAQSMWLNLYFKDSGKFKPLTWARVLSVFSATLAFSLSSVSWLFLESASTWDYLLVTAFIIMPTFGSIVFAASYLTIHIGWTIFSIAPLGLYFIFSKTPDLIYLGYGLIFAAIPAVIWFGLVVSREFMASLKMRYENLRLIEELQVQKKLAEKASSDKSRFLAAVSHDLRQPLHAFDLFHSSLKSRLKQREQQRLLGLASHSSHALGEMLGELTDIVRFDAGKIVPEPRILPLAPLLRECTDEMRPIAEEMGLQMRVRIPGKGCVDSDPVLLKRILRNLISNAIRHTASGGVLVGTRMRGGWAAIEVYDTGPGIGEEQLSHIFDEFYQIDNPERDREKGLGLGLAIVRRVAEMLGHRIAVRSRPGRGSCFSVAAPLCSAVDQCKPGSVIEQVVDFADVSGLFAVVVDDDRAILQGMRELLLDWGCEVLLAESEADLLSELRTNPYPRPDILITDYRLRDGRTGLQVVESIRAHFGEAIPAVIISGDVHPEVQQKVSQTSCRWLEKPVQDQALRRIMVGLARAEE